MFCQNRLLCTAGFRYLRNELRPLHKKDAMHGGFRSWNRCYDVGFLLIIQYVKYETLSFLH